MIQLEVKLELKPEKEQEFLDIFRDQFAPAMSKQSGFVRVSLLKQRENKSRYQIEIVFESEEKRCAWVKTKEHEDTWPKLAALIKEYFTEGYDYIIEVTPQFTSHKN